MADEFGTLDFKLHALRTQKYNGVMHLNKNLCNY